MIFDWFTKHPKATRLSCIGIVIFTVLVSVSHCNNVSGAIITYMQTWSTPLGVLAALILLYVVYISVLKENENRKQDRLISFRRQCLNEIITWVLKVHNQVLRLDYTDMADIPTRSGFEKVLHSYIIEGRWVLQTANILDENLHKQIENITKKIMEYYVELKANGLKATDFKWELVESLVNIIEVLSDIREKEKL